MSEKLKLFKNSFALSPQLLHLNNAGLSPISLPAYEIVKYWAERFLSEGMHCNDDYMAAAEVAREQIARLANVEAGQIAFFQSTAGAISQVAFGMSLKAGDEVLMWDQEYLSNLYPWKAACDRRGAKLCLVPSDGQLNVPLEKLLAAVTVHTKVIAISWVQYQTGALTDLKKLADFAKARNIWTVVDVIQGFGILPFDFSALGIDAACGGSHKWMASPVGVGFLILRRERVAELKPLTVGGSTYGTCDDPADLSCTPKQNALRFESGSKQVLEITALGASADLIYQVGVETIYIEAARLAKKLKEGLAQKGANLHLPEEASEVFVNFTMRGESVVDVVQKLKSARVSHALRGPGVRLTPQAFNSDEDIARVLAVL